MSEKYTLKLLSNDIELHSKFVSIGLFDDVTVEDSLENSDDWPSIDILLISDRTVNFNVFIDFYTTNKHKFKKVFYMLSDDTDRNTVNMRNVMKSKGVNIIPPKLTINQIVEKICRDTGTNIAVNKNIFAFFGADSKVGTSIITQTIAENIAIHSRCSVLLLNLSGQPSADYFSVNDILNLDSIKVKIINKVLQPKELVDTCFRKENLYILPTSKSYVDMRHYHPEHIENLILLASQEFDTVLIDAGCNVNLGMCIGALNSTVNKFLVTTQQDNALRNFEMLNEQVFSVHELTPKDFLVIINKYINSPDLYTPSQLAELYKSTLAGTIQYLELGWQAERDKCTFLKYENEEYNRQIEDISLLITEQLGIEYIRLAAKKKNFIQKIFG